jgi:Sec-independent protein secretion pathway component TatC
MFLVALKGMRIIRSLASEMLIPNWKMHIVGLAYLSTILSPDGNPAKMPPIFVLVAGLYFSGIALWKWKTRRRAMGEPRPEEPTTH